MVGLCENVLVKQRDDVHGRQCAKDRKELRALVHMLIIEIDTAIFPGSCALLDHPLALWRLIASAWVGGHCMIRSEEPVKNAQLQYTGSSS